MTRFLRVAYLRFKAGIIESQIDHGHALMRDHELRLANCYAELRKIRAQEAMITPGHTLLAQAMKRAGK